MHADVHFYHILILPLSQVCVWSGHFWLNTDHLLGGKASVCNSHHNKLSGEEHQKNLKIDRFRIQKEWITFSDTCNSQSPTSVIKDFTFRFLFTFPVIYFMWASPWLFFQIVLTDSEITFSLRYYFDGVMMVLRLFSSIVVVFFPNLICFLNLCFCYSVEFLKKKKNMNVRDAGIYSRWWCCHTVVNPIHINIFWRPKEIDYYKMYKVYTEPFECAFICIVFFEDKCYVFWGKDRDIYV